MAQGKAAMWVDATVAAGAPDRPQDLQGRPRTSASPTRRPRSPRSARTGCGRGRSRSKRPRKNKDAAFKFLTWATSKDYIKLVAAKNGWASVPPGTRISTYTNPNYKKAAAAFAPHRAALDADRRPDPLDPAQGALHRRAVRRHPRVPGHRHARDPEPRRRASPATPASTSALTLSQQQVTRIMQQAGYLK